MNATKIILALIIVFGVMSLLKSSEIKEPFLLQIPIGNSGIDSSLDPLMDLSDALDISKNLNSSNVIPLPPEEKPIWLCDSKWTGKPIRAINMGIDCADPNYNCQTKEAVEENCSYVRLPSTTSADVDISTIDQIEEEKQDIPSRNVYIPPTMNKCKLGCKKPIFSNIDLDSYSLWTCDQSSVRKDLITLQGMTEDESNVDLCKHDIDCIWCNSVGYS